MGMGDRGSLWEKSTSILGLKRQVDVGQVKRCSNVLFLWFGILNIHRNVAKARSVGKTQKKDLCKENVGPRIFGRGEYVMSWIERAGDEGDTFEQELPIQGSTYNDRATHWDVFKKIICVFSSSCIQTQ